VVIVSFEEIGRRFSVGDLGASTVRWRVDEVTISQDLSIVSAPMNPASARAQSPNVIESVLPSC